MKRVLIVAYHFPPNSEVGGRRPLALANFLPDFGWEPAVLTVRTPDQVAIDPHTTKELRRDVQVFRTRALEITRLGRRLRRSGNWKPVFTEVPVAGVTEARAGLRGWLREMVYKWLFFPDKRVGWVPFALAAALRQQARLSFDAIITTSPPPSVHLVGLIFKALNPSVPWVADYRDLWTQSTQSIAFYPRFRVLLEKTLERRVLQAASRVVATSWNSRLDLLDDFGLDDRKVTVIPNGYEPWLEAVVRDVRPNGRFRISITGRIYPGTARPLFDGVDLALRLEPRLRRALEILLMGHPDDPDLRRLPEKIRRFVRLESFKDKYQAARAQAESALLVCPVPPVPYADGWIPYRLVEYLSRRRPILVIAKEGDARELARRSGVSAVADPNDVEGIAETVLAAFHRYERKGVEVDPNPTVLREWDVRNRVRQFAELLDALFDERRAN